MASIEDILFRTCLDLGSFSLLHCVSFTSQVKIELKMTIGRKKCQIISVFNKSFLWTGNFSSGAKELKADGNYTVFFVCP